MPLPADSTKRIRLVSERPFDGNTGGRRLGRHHWLNTAGLRHHRGALGVPGRLGRVSSGAEKSVTLLVRLDIPLGSRVIVGSVMAAAAVSRPVLWQRFDDPVRDHVGSDRWFWRY